MREIVFHLDERSSQPLCAKAEHPPLTIQAATLEELQHEAREALIHHFGSAHVAYRVRVRRPLQRHPDHSPRLPVHSHGGAGNRPRRGTAA